MEEAKKKLITETIQKLEELPENQKMQMCLVMKSMMMAKEISDSVQKNDGE